MFITTTEQKWFQSEYPVNSRLRLIWAGGESVLSEGETGTIVKSHSNYIIYIIVKWDSGSKTKLFYGNFLAEVFKKVSYGMF